MARAAADRCAWSGARSSRVVMVELPGVDRLGRGRKPVTVPVLPEHETALRAHVNRLHRYGSRFLVAIVLLGILSFAAAMAPVIDRSWATAAIPAAGILLAAMGLLFVALPFSTPETSSFFGVARSIAITRFLGVILVAAGAAAALLG